MTLATGAAIGPFEVLGAIGAGGMGEVYRARDTRLKREVALKVLPDAFAHDPDRLARFQREAELLATLNHPNIAAVHGLEQAGGISAIVLELVEGDTLAELIARGPLPIADALPIARQIADALESAHEKGVIHRDLKPGNIKVTADGRVKVLDFGLAKLLESDTDAHALTMSPTMSVHATRAGVILGTAAYMSPEQARGKRVDRRADIWAFGCVLFEMLTGKQAFDPGETVSDAIAAVLTKEPDWSALPADTPAAVRTLLRRCLQKDPQKRLPHIGVARLEIDEGGAGAAPQPGARASGRRVPRLWAVTTAVLLATAVGLGLVALNFYRALAQGPSLQFSVFPPENTSFESNPVGFVPLVSPDGRRLAFTARDASGSIRIWVRPLDALDAQPLQGSDGASYPFWSPDSRSIAFFAQGQLKRIDLAGGPPLTLANAASGRGGTWNRDGVILFAPANTGPLYRVAAAGGGEPVAVTTTESGSHRFPSFLPDGRRFLYASAEQPGLIEIRVGDLGSTESTRLLVADAAAIYATSGDLLFVRQGTLLRQSLDLRTLALSGDPTPVAESVGVGNVGAFSVSNTGVLAYQTGLGSTGEVELAWFDRSGKLIETIGVPAPLRGIDLSPDGRRVAVHRHDASGGDVWVLDLERRGTMTRFTFDASQENAGPVWSPDGSRIAFGSRRNGMWGLYEKAANGAGGERLLVESDLQKMPMTWAPDGKLLAYWVADPKTLADQWILPFDGDRKPLPLFQTIFSETHPQISPNGKWIAYQSNESGRAEVYVRPFPTGEGKWQISNGGGVWTRWRPDGTELFYMTNASLGKLMSVKVAEAGQTFQYGDPIELFDSGYVNFGHGGGNYHTYAVSPDGQRFLIPRPKGAANAPAAPVPVTVVVNWTRALAR